MESFLFNLQHVDPIIAYAFLFASAFVENVFPPIPGDTVTIFGAYLVGRGVLNFWGVYIATTLGSITGFMTIYGIAFYLEWKVLEKYQAKWMAKNHIQRVEAWFQRFGYWVVLANRFLSGARSVISLAAGLTRMRPVPVFLLALVSCAIWNGLLIYLGASLGKNWQEVVQFVKTYNTYVLTLLVFLGIAYFLFRWSTRKRESQ